MMETIRLVGMSARFLFQRLTRLTKEALLARNFN